MRNLRKEEVTIFFKKQKGGVEAMSWNSDADHTQADLDNHANQLNPNNDEYYHSRGEE